MCMCLCWCVACTGTSILCCVCAEMCWHIGHVLCLCGLRALRSCVVSVRFLCGDFDHVLCLCGAVHSWALRSRVCVVCCYDNDARPRDSADLKNGLRAIHVSTLRRSAQAARVARGSIWLKCMQLVDHVFTLKAAGFPR